MKRGVNHHHQKKITSDQHFFEAQASPISLLLRDLCQGCRKLLQRGFFVKAVQKLQASQVSPPREMTGSGRQ